MYVFVSLLFLTVVTAQQFCTAYGGYGSCTGGTACATGYTCINDVVVKQEICCSSTEIAVKPNATTPSTTACVDKLNPNTGVSDCPGTASYCSDSVYYSLMTVQCPETCGRCSGTGGGTGGVTAPPSTCVDRINPSTGVSDCPARASYCNNSAYYTLMTEECPRTCGRCSGSGISGGTVTSAPASCVDKMNPNTGVSDCPGMVSYCNNAVYYTLMTEQCPRTCGRCSG